MTLYESYKINSSLHYYINAINLAEAHRAAYLLWGNGVKNKIIEVPAHLIPWVVGVKIWDAPDVIANQKQPDYDPKAHGK